MDPETKEAIAQLHAAMQLLIQRMHDFECQLRLRFKDYPIPEFMPELKPLPPLNWKGEPVADRPEPGGD